MPACGAWLWSAYERLRPSSRLGLCIQGTSKDALGTVNHPVVVGGQLITPGYIVVGDDDGVVVVRTEDVKRLAKACEDREAAEAQLIEQYKLGQMSIEDRYETMRKKGCIWSD